jgi:hypothetical protein
LAKKSTKQERTLSDVAPIIKLALVQRLTDEDAHELLAKHGYEMSLRTYQRYKKEYKDGTTARFLEIAKCEWANEHLTIIDTIAKTIQEYWRLYEEAENPTEAKHILDSIRASQHDLTLFYNETPLMEKIKQALESKLEDLQNAKKLP